MHVAPNQVCPALQCRAVIRRRPSDTKDLDADVVPIRRASLLSVVVMVGAQIGCVKAETPGDLFRKQMSQLEGYCTNRVFSPGDITCDMLKLKTEDPLATPEGRLAHSIKIPPTVPPKSYRFGMTSNTYFLELCQEAGEFIFRTVSDVDGVMQLRPRSLATGQMLRHLYALEDPYGYRDWEARRPELIFVRPTRYRFLERPVDVERLTGPVVRYHGYDGRNRETMNRETALAAESRYGFLWRGISRPNDREMGIAGGELIVIDLNSREVLGVKRGFVRTGDSHLGIWWLSPTTCSDGANDVYDLAEFVAKVLKPIRR